MVRAIRPWLASLRAADTPAMHIDDNGGKSDGT